MSALTSYLATLTSPKLWSDLTGDTTIVGSTFRTRFADVYTTRQALLNAIYAAAKAKADAAQDTANTAVGQVTQMPVINGGFDIAPTGYGWTADSGTGWIIDTGSNSPGVQPNCARHTGTSSPTTGAYRNNGLAPCQPGQVYKTQALIKAVGANGTCYVYISWCNAAGGEIGTTIGNAVTGTTTAGSYAVGAAPAGTVFARTCLAYSGQTAGDYFVDNVVCTQYPSSVGEVPDGGGYQKTPVMGGSAIVVGNANFEAPLDPMGNVPGWKPINGAVLSYNTAGAYSGVQCLTVTGGAGTSNFGAESPRFQCSAGDEVTANIQAFPYIGGRAVLAIVFWSGATIINYVIVNASVYSSWQKIAVSGIAGAGASSLSIQLYNDNTNGGQCFFDELQVVRKANIDTEVKDGSTYGRTSQNDLYVSGGVNRIGLRVAGSGMQIGDQRNLVSSITRNLGITRSATALTANAGGAVDINAHTIQMGGASVSYSAKSNAVTGLATSASYYIYTRDNYAGGSPTWAASTNQNTVNSYDDAYNAGVVTIPTSGTSGGGSGGTGISGCVSADMYLRSGLTARQLAERWRWWRPCILRGQDGWHFVRRRPRIQPEPCCTITMADGSTLTCSLSTPVTVRTGESILAPMVYGHDLFTDSGWQRVIDVELLPGERDVVRISTGGHSFLAGMHPHLRISTHNTIKA